MAKFGSTGEIARHCERERARLWREFEGIKPELVQIARYVYPAALPGLTRDVRDMTAAEEYDDDDAKRFTSVPFDAFAVAHGGFYTNLTNPNSQWFRIKPPFFVSGDGEDSRKDYVTLQYSRLTETTRNLMTWCGAYRALAMAFKHLVAFGFAAILVEEDEERGLRTTCLRVGTYALGTDRRGRADRMVRRFGFTASQLVEEFGRENVSESVLEAARRGDDARREVWSLVEPHARLAGVPSPYSLSTRKFAYRVTYWSSEAGRPEMNGVLAVRGYRVRPVVAARLAFEAGDVYGRGCGHDVLGHCSALQTVSEACFDLADQEAHPAMMAPASMANDGLRLGPLEVNFYPDGLGRDAVYRACGEPPRGELAERERLRLEAEIRKAFFNSEFETINTMEDSTAMTGGRGDRMTATEVRARVNEKMEQLSGMATTLNDELLDPFVTAVATYALLLGYSDADIPAAEGRPLPWDVKYESALHAAANAQVVNAATSALSVAADYARVSEDPSVFDNFDADAMVRDIHRRLGAPETYLRPVRERDEARAARAQEAARTQEVEENAVRAKTAKDLAATQVDPASIGGPVASAGAAEGAVA